MNKLPHDSDFLSAELLRKYRDGTLSPEEAQQVARLRDDPFHADALTGVEQLPDGETFTRQTADLREQLQGRLRQPSRPWYIQYAGRIAATVMLLLVSSYVIYTFVTPSTIEIAEEEMAPAPAASPLAKPQEAPPPLAYLSPEDLVTPSLISRMPSIAPVITPVADEAVAEDVVLELSEDNISSDIPASELSEEAPALSEELRSKAPADQPSSQKRVRGVSPMPQPANTQVVVGQVVDADTQEPLPGVNVLVKDTTLATITNIEGQFAMQIPVGRSLSFSFIGYEAVEVEASSSPLSIALSPDVASLSEVVVVGYGTQRKADPASTAATPVGGMRSFKQYLKESLRHPPEVAVEEVKGTVKVDFMVGADGTLSDFRINKSLCAACDQEAIRLIREGPPWKPSTEEDMPTEEKVTVKVKFK